MPHVTDDFLWELALCSPPGAWCPVPTMSLRHANADQSLLTDLNKFIATAKEHYNDDEECSRLWKSHGKQFLNVCGGTTAGKGDFTPPSSTWQTYVCFSHLQPYAKS